MDNARELIELYATLTVETGPALDDLVRVHRMAVDQVGEVVAAAELLRALAGDTKPAQVAALLTVAIMRQVTSPGED